MKKLPIYLITLLLCSNVFPQKLKQMHIIGTPQKLQSGEMVARRDQNGNYCAAIKVISDMDGFSYDSWNGVVGSVDKNPGKDVVYLTTGERVLEVFKSGYEPLQIILSDLGITLKEREIWQIKIAGDEQADALPVTFRFTPEDATLLIDGEDAANKLTQELSVGKHQIRLVRDGYQAIEKTIEVNKEQVFFQWEMEEAPDAGLQITTQPSGAIVYLDGVELGETPVAAFYQPGTYPIEISNKGYVTIDNESLEVTLPKTTKNYILEENVGYLTINTRDEATVYFNGEEMDNHTRVKLAPQLVRVKVIMPKADDLAEQVVIKKDDDTVLDMYPDIQTGTIQVAVTPFDANIELTGDAGEHYTAQGMKIFKDIPVGTYNLKVTADDYKTTEETVILKPLEKLNKSITLEEGSDADYGIEMVYVKGGTFTMGCSSEQSDCDDDEKPVHEVTVDDFYMGKYEVTVAQFKQFIDETSYRTDAYKEGWSYVYTGSFKKKNGVNWQCDAIGNQRPPSEYNHSVIHVSWNDAVAYCKWLSRKTGKGYRLPTEAEWEYASREGANGSSTKYAGSNNIDDVAWYNGNSGGKTHPVGQKQPNELGIYDMSGNVWEWCADWYDNDYYDNSPRNNPQGPSSGEYRLLRGGSWFDDDGSCRVAHRGRSDPDSGLIIDGFRIAQDF